MTETSASIEIPKITETVAELNRYGSIILSILYFLIIAAVVIFLVHLFSTRILLPRLVNKRFAVVLIWTLYALVLVLALLLILDRIGFDVSVFAPIALLIVLVGAIFLFFLVPYLPSLPFKIGQMVEISGIQGTVKTVSPFFTQIQTFDGRTVFVSNPRVWANNIVNYHHTPDRRIELHLRVPVECSLEDVHTSLTELMRGDERVLDDPAPTVRINSARADGVDLVGLCWVKNADFLGARSDLYEKVLNAVQAGSGIALALERSEVILTGAPERHPER